MALAQDIEDPKFEIIRIGPCHYRKLVIPEDLHFQCEAAREDEEEDEEARELDDQMVYEGDEWMLRLPVAAVFHRFIVGSKGANKQRIEMESGGRVVVPKVEEQEDAVYLYGRQKQQIYSAKAQIELLCEKEESKLEYTHFLSVPLAHDAKLRQLVDQFREDVIMQRFPDIDASFFMPVKRLHFTLCMLKLHSHAQVEEMKEALQEIAAKIAETADFNRPVAANLKGLHIMTDDPSNVGVIFTTDRSRELQNRMNSLADMIFRILRSRNLASTQNLMAQRLLSSDAAHAEVKLHATLINTKYGKSQWRHEASGGGGGYGGGHRETFDASLLMERNGQVNFGSVNLREIHFSCLDEMGDDGYYRSLWNVPLFNQPELAQQQQQQKQKQPQQRQQPKNKPQSRNQQSRQ
eukprot:TRINITY_DN16633_c0_g1_i1.p1 TRINITY_DN16633_c0_g1~~TRINITY_DN16633_c0_g1_i1.p1  ORF type:complete len:437 (+),score=82.86 TRINITY_DN16633_c0_g1_i1:91-1311(+)